MTLHMQATSNTDTLKLKLKFYLLGHLPSGNYVQLGSSDSEYMFFIRMVKAHLTMILPTAVSITAYDNLMVAITAVNTDSSHGHGTIYFQSLNSYSHVHTTL